MSSDEPPTTSAILAGNPFKVLASTNSASAVAKDVEAPEEAPAADDAAPPEQAKDPDDVLEQTAKKDRGAEAESLINHSLARDKDDKRAKPFVIAVAATAALGGLIFGYDIGGAGATFVMDGFIEHFGWDTASQDQIDTETGLINGLFGAGAALGALAAPLLFNRRGRKPTMAWGAVFFTIGAALQMSAVSMPMLYIPRLLSGGGSEFRVLMLGMLSMCSPVYIAELAPESHRGQLATLWQLAITTGIVLVSILNIWLAEWDEGWRISYGGNIVFSVTLLILLIFMPESPHFLVKQGRDEEARKALGRVRFEDQVEWEMEELEMEAIAAEKRGEATWKQVFDNDNNKMKTRTLTGVLLQTIQQLSGINAIMFYAPIILEDFFGSKGGIYGALVLNIINFCSTFITIFTIEKLGRVLILFSGGIVMCVSLIPTAIMASIDENKEEGTESSQSIGIGITSMCALYVIGFAFSWGPVVWVYCAEMFPLRERGKANSLTTFANWFWATIVGAVFPSASTASLAGCFGFFAGVVFIGILFVYFYLPETSNRTAPEIDEEYLNHKAKLKREKWA
ncbi:hypothetical protein ACHAXT_010914 [Thalassiosira profunda]